MAQRQPKEKKEKRLPRTAWVKGQSGNPKGRPANTRMLAEEIRLLLAQPHNETMTKRQALAFVMVQKALEGEFKFCKEILDRVDGKVSDLPEGTDVGAVIVNGIRRLLANNEPDPDDDLDIDEEDD